MKHVLAGVVLALTPLMMCGCPQVPDAAADATAGEMESGTPGADGNLGANAAKTGILVSTPIGSTGGIYDLFDATGTTRLQFALDTDTIEEVAPGTYVLKEYFNDDFVYAADVKVVKGAVTDLAFGALNVTTVPGSIEATFDIWDAAGTKLLSRAKSDNTVRPLPPGVYVIKEYFNDDFTWASGVQINAGAVTTVPLGAFRLNLGDDWGNPSYDVYAADGVTLLSRPKSANELVPLPAGSFVIYDYFNDQFRYADVQVAAGLVTTVQMGAILYTGGESNYDIYDGSGARLLDRPASRGAKRSVPPGTYVLKDYFTDVVIAAGVVVVPGAVTSVP